jgi:hypothetical protein
MIEVVSRVGVWEGLSGGSVLGFLRVVIVVCGRDWGVFVRLITMAMMSTCVHGLCEWSALKRECIFLEWSGGCP